MVSTRDCVEFNPGRRLARGYHDILAIIPALWHHKQNLNIFMFKLFLFWFHQKLPRNTLLIVIGNILTWAAIREWISIISPKCSQSRTIQIVIAII